MIWNSMAIFTSIPLVFLHFIYTSIFKKFLNTFCFYLSRCLISPFQLVDFARNIHFVLLQNPKINTLQNGHFSFLLKFIKIFSYLFIMENIRRKQTSMMNYHVTFTLQQLPDLWLISFHLYPHAFHTFHIEAVLIISSVFFKMQIFSVHFQKVKYCF